MTRQPKTQWDGRRRDAELGAHDAKLARAKRAAIVHVQTLWDAAAAYGLLEHLQVGMRFMGPCSDSSVLSSSCCSWRKQRNGQNVLPSGEPAA